MVPIDQCTVIAYSLHRRVARINMIIRILLQLYKHRDEIQDYYGLFIIE